MKKITAKQLAMSYTGVFLGAGFVSGQELWQFFACFGPIGLLGFLGTAALFFYVNYANLRMIQVTGVEDMGRLMTRGEKPKLRATVTFMQCLLLFGVTIIMIAGAASLLNQLLSIHNALVVYVAVNRNTIVLLESTAKIIFTDKEASGKSVKANVT